jgi:hypothetical protein
MSFTHYRVDSRPKTYTSCFNTNLNYQPGTMHLHSNLHVISVSLSGPGAYSALSSFGNQITGTKGKGYSNTGSSFTKTPRDRNVAFISKKHSKINAGKHSPAPYKLSPDSRSKPFSKSPQMKFPKAQRFEKYTQHVPDSLR